MFNVETDKGIATANVDGSYMDVGRSGNIAGIEFSVERMRMFDQPREQRHADAVVTLDCTPAVLFQMATMILDKLELPAFTAREWRMIADSMRGKVKFAEAAELRQMADKIDASAAKIDAL